MTVAMTLEERIITVSAARFSISCASIVYLLGLFLIVLRLRFFHGYLILVLLRLWRIENDGIHFRPPFAPGQRALDHAGDELRVDLARPRCVPGHFVQVVLLIHPASYCLTTCAISRSDIHSQGNSRRPNPEKRRGSSDGSGVPCLTSHGTPKRT